MIEDKNLYILLYKENENETLERRSESEIDELDCSEEEKEVLKNELEGITTIEVLEEGMIKCDPDFE